MHRHRARVLLGLLLAATTVRAQRPELHSSPTTLPPLTSPATLPAPDATLDDAVRNLASRAGVIFIGQVTLIERKGGIVEVGFTVQQTVQGFAGAAYTLREWAGLWPQGEQRYIPGQRMMIFLHPVSAAGLSSPVDGMEGILPLVPNGADAAPLLDVRRLATRIRRNVGQPLAAEAVTLADAVAVIQGNATPNGSFPRLLPVISRPHRSSEQASKE